MLHFAEQTGSGAVMLVWSFPRKHIIICIINNDIIQCIHYCKQISNKKEMGYDGLGWCGVGVHRHSSRQ